MSLTLLSVHTHTHTHPYTCFIFTHSTHTYVTTCSASENPRSLWDCIQIKHNDGRRNRALQHDLNWQKPIDFPSLWLIYLPLVVHRKIAEWHSLGLKPQTVLFIIWQIIGMTQMMHIHLWLGCDWAVTGLWLGCDWAVTGLWLSSLWMEAGSSNTLEKSYWHFVMTFNVGGNVCS